MQSVCVCVRSSPPEGARKTVSGEFFQLDLGRARTRWSWSIFLRQKARIHSEQWDMSDGHRGQQKDKRRLRGTPNGQIWSSLNVKMSDHNR